jgi:hypothetical protein
MFDSKRTNELLSELEKLVPQYERTKWTIWQKLQSVRDLLPVESDEQSDEERDALLRYRDLIAHLSDAI